MNQTKATLLYNSPIWLVVRAARICADSSSRSDTEPGADVLGPKDEKFIRNKILKIGNFDVMSPPHESVIEHIVYTLDLEYSRGVLQQSSRHRVASPSVESSRIVLKKLIKKMELSEDISEFVTFTGDEDIDQGIFEQIEIMVKHVKSGKPNDKSKYLVTDALRTRCQITINARSLRNLLVLRTSHHALWEFRQLAFAIYDAIPESHKFMFEDRIHPRPEGF